MSSRTTKLAVVACTLVLLLVAKATAQTRMKGRVYTPGDDPLVAREEVTIEGAGQYTTDDHGEFEFDLAGDLKIGGEARFHVYHVNPAIKIQQWIVIHPCDTENGKTMSLPAVGSSPIPIRVLPKGDKRLISVIPAASILGCAIEEAASEFKPTGRPGGTNHSSLFDKGSSVAAHKIPYRPFSEMPQRGGSLQLIEASLRVRVPETSHVSSLEVIQSHALLDQGQLARQADKLGFTTRELADALDTWVRSVQDNYEKGLAALYDQRYAEASEYISVSIPSPPGDFLKRYIPLARAEYELGHYSTAEAFLRKVLEAHSEDPLILNNLGLVLNEEAKYSEAEQFLMRALAIDEKELGPDDPVVATNLNNLGLLYYSQARYADAEPLYKRALTIDEEAFGLDNPDISIRLNNLALLYYAQGRFADAEPLYKRALTIGERALGPDHPRVATSLNNLAELYRAQGKYAEAEPLYKRALTIDEHALGPDHPDVSVRLNNLGLLYYSQGRYADAEPLYQRALAIDEKALGPDHPRVATNLNNLAKLYSAQGRYAEAERLLKRALAIDEEALGSDHAFVAMRLSNLASLYYSQGKYSEAEPLDKQALAIDEKALGLDHPDVATNLNNLAKDYYSQGRYTEAEPLYKRALVIDEKTLGPEHPTVAWYLNNLGLLYRAQGRFNEAEPLFKRALAIEEKALGPNDMKVAEIAENLAADLHNLGRDAAARVYEEQAAKIRAKKSK